MVSPFSIVPVEVCMDSRLTKMQLRVLIALLSFRSKNTDTIWPKRSQIAERCGYGETVISRITTQLVDLGWLEKVGKGGFSKSCEYRITVPEVVTVTPRETITESVTVDSEETVTNPATIVSEESIPQIANNSDQSGNGDQIGNGDRTSTNYSDQTGQQTVTEVVTRNKQTSIRPVSDQIKDSDFVFAYWQKVTGKTRCELSDAVRRKINSRLKNFSVELVIEAIDGNAKSKFHQGGNDERRVYNSLELICRSDEKLQGFIDINQAESARDSQLAQWMGADYAI